MSRAGPWVWGLAVLVGCVDGALPNRPANDPADPGAAEAPSVTAPTVAAPAGPEASISRPDHGDMHHGADAAASP